MKIILKWFGVFLLLLVNACGVDDGLGKAGQTEEQFFTVLNAPEGVLATAYSGDTVLVEWVKVPSTLEEEGFVVSRSENGIDFVAVTVVPANSYYYIDHGLSSNTDYYYHIRGIRGPFLSDGSAVATAHTFAVVGPPAQPVNFLAVATSVSTIDLTWNIVSDGSVSDYLLRYNGMNAGEYISLGPNVSSHTFDQLLPDTTYDFELIASNLDINGSAQYSVAAIAAARTLPVVTLTPYAPTNLTASVANSTAIDLAWSDNSDGLFAEEGFEIWRDNSLLKTVPGNITTTATYRDTGLAPATSYSYAVRAYNSLATPPASVFSNTISLTTPAIPAAPILNSVSLVFTTVGYKWTDKSSNETGFKLYAYNASCTEVYFNKLLKPSLIKAVGSNVSTANVYLSDIPFKLSSGASYCTYVSAYTPYYTVASNRINFIP